MSEMPHLNGELAPYYYDWLAHPEYDEYWQAICIEDSHPEIAVPALNFGGWHDIFLGGTIRNFTGMRKHGATEDARRGQRLVIGPWIHGGSPQSVSGEHNFGTRAAAGELGLQGEMLRFYDHYLRGEDNGVPDDRPVRIFVMGENVWRYENEWPLERTEWTKYYLHGTGDSAGTGGWLSTEVAAIDESADRFTYDPADSVPSWGAQYQSLDLCGPRDRTAIEERADVLTFTSAVLTEAVEVTGPVTATIWASSDALDTDFTAALIDVEPAEDGEDSKAIILCEGIVRARFRNGTDNPEMMTPGEIYEFEIDMWDTSNLFKEGHRIRIENHALRRRR